MWAIFKVFIEFVTILLLFCFVLASEVLDPWPGIEQAPPALEGKVPTAGLQGSPEQYRIKSGH